MGLLLLLLLLLLHCPSLRVHDRKIFVCRHRFSLGRYRPARNRIPRGSICAYHRSPPAATSRTDIAIIEGGNCDLQVSSSSSFAPLIHHLTNRDHTTTSNNIS